MRTLTRPIGPDVLLALDDMSARFCPSGFFDFLNTLVWCKILLGPEKTVPAPTELPKWPLIASMNARNLQHTLVLVTRTSHTTKLADTTQSQPKSA